ncbi:hypothetical protein J8273_8617 [Carpediemonas membranifera]|uniref:Uncharacterized protein n=1 Tax=Carpediemonas membranifera TaxID=201153 RepID=A0A8J6AR09_9EUKA|nr:hypothetical protein J8273_8617 [Carpediemonas membranifera]|eukprot:KAG9389930.1 hypothetical protein J8273_8617 [Carpediemonas membranifera]
MSETNCNCPGKCFMNVASWKNPYLSTIVFLSGVIGIHLVASGKMALLPILSILLLSYIVTGLVRTRMLHRESTVPATVDVEVVKKHLDVAADKLTYLMEQFATAYNWSEPKTSLKVILTLCGIFVVSTVIPILCAIRMVWWGLFVGTPVALKLKENGVTLDISSIKDAVMKQMPGLRDAVARYIAMAKDVYKTKIHPKIAEKLNKKTPAKKTD